MLGLRILVFIVMSYAAVVSAKADEKMVEIFRRVCMAPIGVSTDLMVAAMTAYAGANGMHVDVKKTLPNPTNQFSASIIDKDRRQLNFSYNEQLVDGHQGYHCAVRTRESEQELTEVLMIDFDALPAPDSIQPTWKFPGMYYYTMTGLCGCSLYIGTWSDPALFSGTILFRPFDYRFLNSSG